MENDLNIIGFCVLIIGGLVIWSALSGEKKKHDAPAPPLPLPEIPARSVHQSMPPQHFNQSQQYQDAYQHSIDPAMLQQALQLLQVVQILQGNQGKNGHNTQRRGIQWRQDQGY